MSNTFSKVCSHQLPGSLFQSAINEKHLAIESRDTERTYFSIFDLKNGELKAELTPKAITPWHSLHSIEKECLILQYFENKKNPDSLTYFSFNLTNEELIETEINDSLPIKSRIPGVILPETSEFETVKQFIGSEIVLGCEYDEFDEHILVSYYKQHSDIVSRHLMVLCDGEEKYHEIQDSDMKGFAPGSFFTSQNRLIFVTGKTQINIYEI